MTWVERRATDGGTLTLRADYEYDAFANRIEKEVDDDGDTTIELTERYAYDGWKPVNGELVGNENWDVWADLTGSNTIHRRYVRGDKIDELIARIESGDLVWNLNDRMGSVRDILDKNATLKSTIKYNGHGEIISETDKPWRGRYSWNSREHDEETEFRYNRARYYDPEVAKWTSEDPERYGAGDTNLFRYVKNRPTVATDPSGLFNYFQVAQGIIYVDSVTGNRIGKVAAFTGKVIQNVDQRVKSDLQALENRYDAFLEWQYHKAKTNKNDPLGPGFYERLKEHKKLSKQMINDTILAIPHAIEFGIGIVNGVKDGLVQQGRTLAIAAGHLLYDPKGFGAKIYKGIQDLVEEVGSDLRQGNLSKVADRVAEIGLGSLYHLAKDWKKGAHRNNGVLVGHVIAEFAPQLIMSAATSGAAVLATTLLGRTRNVFRRARSIARHADDVFDDMFALRDDWSRQYGVHRRIDDPPSRPVGNAPGAIPNALRTIRHGTDIGTYRQVGGHHIHAKAAFRGTNSTYNQYQGLSLSQDYIRSRGWDHQAMTSRQRQLFDELASSGRPNTLTEHSRIAEEALVSGGASRQEAEWLVQQSTANLQQQGVSAPTRIPWN